MRRRWNSHASATKSSTTATMALTPIAIRPPCIVYRPRSARPSRHILPSAVSPCATTQQPRASSRQPGGASRSAAHPHFRGLHLRGPGEAQCCCSSRSKTMATPSSSPRGRSSGSSSARSCRSSSDGTRVLADRASVEDLRARTLGLLDALEAGDTAAWWQCNRILTVTPGSNIIREAPEDDLTRFPGWQLLTPGEKARLVAGAERYLDETTADTEHWAGHRHALQQLTALAQLGTPAAVAAVERIAAHFPERPGLRQVLLDAEERMRQNTWIPLQPASR